MGEREKKARRYRHDWFYIAYGIVFGIWGIISLVTDLIAHNYTVWDIVWDVAFIVLIAAISLGFGTAVRRNRITSARRRDESDKFEKVWKEKRDARN